MPTARNLARQPKTPAALDLLERAHRLHRDAAHALQRGSRPAEQRVAEGLPQATLHHAWQRRTVVARVAGLAGRLDSLARERSPDVVRVSYRLGTGSLDCWPKSLVASPGCPFPAPEVQNRRFPGWPSCAASRFSGLATLDEQGYRR
jgi:hypothetical protein